MTPEQIKQLVISKAFANICEGSCEEHRGECFPVFVEDALLNNSSPYWYFSYCEEAIAEDKRRGFSVAVQDVIEMRENKDER